MDRNWQMEQVNCAKAEECVLPCPLAEANCNRKTAQRLSYTKGLLKQLTGYNSQY